MGNPFFTKVGVRFIWGSTEGVALFLFISLPFLSTFAENGVEDCPANLLL
jgi:hypothetical protein